MLSIKSAFAATAVGAAALIATATPASAAPAEKFATVYSLADGPCVAQVNASVAGDAYPSSAAFTVSGTLYGVGSCKLTVTLNWRNDNTGETGTRPVTLNGPGFWGNDGRSAIFSPGIGDFTATLTVGGAHVPEPGTVKFSVHQYQS
ncbi:hypothetical protein [Nocardia australiensis]|uniref:hypothetical protein n=1 Tax=Nocardia australiensis TaxID=2887191 RepID=UPI001D141D52|nr:hypothetical protein [Nocardia australiensis]